MHVKRVTLEQQLILLSWLEKNPDIAIGRNKAGSDGSFEQEWSTITRKLNNHGVEKNVKKWQQVWRDWKGNVKKKQQKLKPKREEKERSGGVNTDSSLSAFEQRILALIGGEHSQTPRGSLPSESVKIEPLEVELGSASDSDTDESCSWELPTPAAIGGVPRTSHPVSSRPDRDENPLDETVSQRTSMERHPRHLHMSRRRLRLSHRRLHMERERLKIERARLDTLDRLTDEVARLTRIAERFEAKFLDKDPTADGSQMR